MLTIVGAWLDPEQVAVLRTMLRDLFLRHPR
jgi:hypothetical protein